MRMNEPNPYGPPRSQQTKAGRIGPISWVVLWFISGTIFCAAAFGGDPFTSLIMMGFGAASFVTGDLFARAGDKGVIPH